MNNKEFYHIKIKDVPSKEEMHIFTNDLIIDLKKHFPNKEFIISFGDVEITLINNNNLQVISGSINPKKIIKCIKNKKK